MSALMHTLDEKAPRVHTACKPPSFSVSLCRSSPFATITEGGEKFNYKKVLAFRQFGFSRNISSRIQPPSLSPSHSLSLSLSCTAFHRLLVSPHHPFLSFFLTRAAAAASLRSRVSAVYSSPPRTAHHHPPLFPHPPPPPPPPTAASPLAAHAFYKAPLYNILLIMR